MSLALSLARAVAQISAPVAVALEGPDQFSSFLAELGYGVALDPEQMAVIQGLLPVDALDDLVTIADRLSSGDGMPGEVVAEAITIGQSVVTAISGLSGLSVGSLTALAAPLDDPTTWADIAATAPDHLLVTWLRLEHPLLFATLVLGGVIVTTERAVGLPPEHALDWAAFGRFLSDPSDHFTDTYGWGGDLDHERLIQAIGGCLRAAGIVARLADVPPALAEQWFDGAPPDDVKALRSTLVGETIGDDAHLTLGLVALPIPADGTNDSPSRILLTNEIVGATGDTVDLGDGWELVLDGTADASGTFGVAVGPDGTVLAGTDSSIDVGLAIQVHPATPWALLGGPTGTRVELRSASLELAVSGSTAEPELTLTAGSTDGLALLVEPSDADSFVAGLLGGVAINVETGLLIEWSSGRGLELASQAGFVVTIPLGLTFGPVALDRLEIALGGGAEGWSAAITVSASAALGPLAVAVEGVGVSAALAPRSDGMGSLGSADLQFAFVPPQRLGIAIDVGAVSGGGYLAIDAEAGTYEGIVDVDVLGVGISAVVIIETEAPGVDGWSMFFALFLDLPSIQLGFGFTLTGVGGVAGINRTLDPEALGAAVRSGSLDAVLFPEDPVVEAPVIIDTFKAIFPAANDRVVFGPIVRIGWGTPTLVEAELGIVLALPDPVTIAVLGSVSAILPTPDVDLVAINLDIGGVIDFGAQSLTLSASLQDSHVVGFALSGDMELRANFGGQPDFLMALGGFHPDFVAPVGFPSLGRLRLALNPSPMLEVSFECYLALTSNSVQFGAALDLAAEIAGFGIAGGASFDAMVQFSPFMLSTSLGFYISVTAAGIDLAGVWLDVAVKGPNPWAIDGVARFKVLGFEEQIDVHEIIGSRRDEPAIDPVDTRTALIEALSSPDAWAVVSSPSGAGVTLAAAAPADGRQLASPDSTLAASQQLVPLGLDLAHVGEAPIGDFHRFDLEALKDGVPATGSTVDWFAPATFFDLSPIEAISGPSFEQLANGITLGGGDAAAGLPIAGSLEYEQILRDPEMGIERLDLDDPYRPLKQDRSKLATAHSQTLPAGNSYVATVDEPKHVDNAVYALVDPATSKELARLTSWSAARNAAGSPTARATVIAPTWELTS